MKRVLPVIRASVTFLSREVGGRTTIPELSSGEYRPHIVIQSPDVRAVKVIHGNEIVDDYSGVRFLVGPKEPVGDQPLDCEMELSYYPTVDYDAVRKGATFTVREGGKVTGFGIVTGRTE